MQNIKKPTLLVNKKIAVNNIRTMKLKADSCNIVLRPHFKTHQSAKIGEWFRSIGIRQITVSSVEMANYFAENGWKDITIAFPLNIRELNEVIELNEEVDLTVLISSIDQLEALSQLVNRPINYYIKIDVGYHRSGLEINQIAEIQELINKQDNRLIFSGLLSHFGDTYKVNNVNEILKKYNSGVEALQKLKGLLTSKTKINISIGDTPSCSLVDQFSGIDEIRPGNFVYYDLMQKQLGVCSEKEIAAVVACPVIDIYHQRNEVLIYGGAVHLSKEYIIDNQGNKNFGEVVFLTNNGWGNSLSNTYVKSLSQEHGIISVSKKLISNLKIGDLIGVVPVHSCLSANLLRDVFVINTSSD